MFLSTPVMLRKFPRWYFIINVPTQFIYPHDNRGELECEHPSSWNVKDYYYIFQDSCFKYVQFDAEHCVFISSLALVKAHYKRNVHLLFWHMFFLVHHLLIACIFSLLPETLPI